MSSATEWDESLFEGEEQGQDESNEVRPGERVVFTDTADQTIDGLFKRYKRGTLDLQPDFQREYVWDDKLASRLIESVFINIPLPVVYLAEEEDGKLVVIDGQQRLTSFFNFLDGRLSLRSLESRKDLNGKRFSDLVPKEQDAFESFAIRTITILSQSKSSIKFEMFYRINSGSVALNDQELRNCVYRGPYNDLLKRLAQEDMFRGWFVASSLKRMRDMELVLRFLAFHHTHYSHYTSMRSFLNDDMKAHQQIDERASSELTATFRKSVRLCHSLTGEQGFRRFYAGSEGANPDGRWSDKPNVALYDVLMYGFTQYSQNQIMQSLDALREGLLWLMTSDKDFDRATDNSTGNRSAVLTRFDRWMQMMKDTVGVPSTEPRAFSRTLKEGLYNASPDCAICGGRISTVDDAAVDHVEQYWQGGRTIPDNARLAHRYCNNARPRNE